MARLVHFREMYLDLFAGGFKHMAACRSFVQIRKVQKSTTKETDVTCRRCLEKMERTEKIRKRIGR